MFAVEGLLRHLPPKHRPRGVTVSTLDSESSDRGSNPREASSPCRRAPSVAEINSLPKDAHTHTLTHDVATTAEIHVKPAGHSVRCYILHVIVGSLTPSPPTVGRSGDARLDIKYHRASRYVYSQSPLHRPDVVSGHLHCPWKDTSMPSSTLPSSSPPSPRPPPIVLTTAKHVQHRLYSCRCHEPVSRRNIMFLETQCVPFLVHSGMPCAASFAVKVQRRRVAL